jgi:hypothetical protein
MIPECRHIKTNGLKCHSPAMRGSAFCYFHGRTRLLAPRGRKKDKPLQFPLLTDSASILRALNEVLQALASRKIDTDRAGKLFYALQMAQQAVLAVPDPQPPEPQSSKQRLPASGRTPLKP